MNEEVEQLCVKVPVKDGETIRRELISKDLIDRTLRPHAADGFLFIPVVCEVEGLSVEREFFKASKEREELARHEQIGGIVVLQDDDKVAAEKILAARPSVHTALFATSPVEGEFRTKSFKVLAGESTTRTVYTEYGKKMIVDMSAAYFSARLSNERRRLLSLMREGEDVLDMFCGVGPFPVTLGDKAGFVLANDINPYAIYLMQQNLRLNRLSNVVPMVGDAKNLPDALGDLKFDRIIMNLPFDAYEFLEAAAKLAKLGATVHLYSLVESEGEHTEDILRAFPGAKISEKFIRSYSPTSNHTVYDIEV